MTTTITQWTPLLDEGAVGATATMPTIAAGSNRRVLILIAAYNGGGNSQPPASITINGITRNQLAGDTVARDRPSLGLYVFTESEIATISEQSIASTATGTQKTILYKLRGDSTQGEIAHNAAYSDVTADLAMGLARVANSQTELIGFSSTTGHVLTSSNPTNDGNVSLTSGRCISWAEQPEAADITADTVVNGNARTSAVVLNIGPAVAIASITSVNGGTDTARIGESVPVEVSNFTDPVDAGTIDGVTLPAASSTSITLPSFAPGALVPRVGASRTLVLTRGAQSATRNITVQAPYVPDVLVEGNPVAYEYVTAEVGFNTGANNSIVFGFDPPMAAGRQIFYDPTKGYVTPQMQYVGDHVGEQIMWDYDPSTKIIRQFTVITSQEDTGIRVKLKRPLKRSLKRRL